jgi:aminoglycoside phosphotransferase (APT) family kinase protein
MRRSVPAPLGRFSYGGLAVGIESCAPGSSVLVSSGRRRTGFAGKVRDLQAGTDWLAAYHRQVQLGPAEQGAGDFLARVEHVLRCYADAFGIESSEERLFALVRAKVRALQGVPLPIVWQHGDFGPWNVYRSGDDVTVIDWEVRQGPMLDSAGPPLCDLLYFVTYWSFAARRLSGEAAEMSGLRDLFVEPDRSDPVIDAAWEAIEGYLARLAVDRRFLSSLLVYTWAKRALEDVSRHRILDQLSTAPRTGNQFVDWIGMLAKESDCLFPAVDASEAIAVERPTGFRRVVSR